MAKPGPLEVILVDRNELVFKVCSMKCAADFLVCYEPESSDQNVLEGSCDTKCGFYINTLSNKISFMEPITSKHFGVEKSDQCFEENAYIKHETTTAPPPTTTTIGQLDRTSSGKNGHATTTAEPENFFADYWWIFLILGILIAIGIGIGVGVYCYLRRKNNAQKPVPFRRRKLQGSKSPIVLQPSTETQNGNNESAVRPNSLYNQSSILSHKSLLNSKKEEANKEKLEETDLTSMKPTA
uniref:Uncharacterized protein n=1 Tax=Panagrolaimus sp. PS1159 TaxID=55785 RepID=A0AC35F646_9BILA